MLMLLFFEGLYTTYLLNITLARVDFALSSVRW